MNVQVWLPRGVTLALGALHSGNTLYRNVPTSGVLQSSLLQPLGQDAAVAAMLCRSCLCCAPCELSCCSQCPGSTWGPALRAGGDGSSGGIPQLAGEELGGWRRSGERATRCDGHDLCAQAGWGEAACGTGAWMNAALRGVRGDRAQGTAQRAQQEGPSHGSPLLHVSPARGCGQHAVLTPALCLLAAKLCPDSLNLQKGGRSALLP